MSCLILLESHWNKVPSVQWLADWHMISRQCWFSYRKSVGAVSAEAWYEVTASCHGLAMKWRGCNVYLAPRLVVLTKGLTSIFLLTMIWKWPFYLPHLVILCPWEVAQGHSRPSLQLPSRGTGWPYSSIKRHSNRRQQHRSLCFGPTV